jgi:GNAT superfamily N-acetyltransferase
MNIRLAQEHEVSVIQAIGIDADTRFLATAYPEVCDGSSIPSTAAQAAIAQGRLWVALGNADTPVGWVYVSRLSGEYCVGHISVLVAYGRQGIGTALMETAKEDARARGEPSMVLAAQCDVPWSGPWYERMGYVALEPSQWTDAMRSEAIRQGEGGLDWGARAFMRLSLK